VTPTPAAAPPLIPDGEEGREWARRELADPTYDAAEPTFLDRAASAVGEFFADLFSADVPPAIGSTFALVAAVVVAAVILAAFLIWGLPRATHRARGTTRTLFDQDEERTADELRRDAAVHAHRGEWAAAIVLRFRALARGTVERGVVHTPPGTTVHGFARAAARAFPGCAGVLEDAAAAFDDVRYLRRPGTEALYRAVVTADEAVVAQRAATAAAVPA
jgi:hypothetical protein